MNKDRLTLVCDYLNSDLALHGVHTASGAPYRIDAGKLAAALDYGDSVLAARPPVALPASVALARFSGSAASRLEGNSYSMSREVMQVHPAGGEEQADGTFLFVGDPLSRALSAVVRRAYFRDADIESEADRAALCEAVSRGQMAALSS
jgi:hypothetical protein